MPAGGFTGAQVHRDACVRSGIGDGILTVAAVQSVRAGTTIQPVSAGAARDDVVFTITGQRVRVRAADNVLETPNTVPCCVPPGGFTSAQVHCDAHGPYMSRPCIGNGIHAVAAIQGVRAVAASQPVIAGAALQRVVSPAAVITGQRVRILAADNALETPDTVTCCVPARGCTGAQVHGDSCVRAGI